MGGYVTFQSDDFASGMLDPNVWTFTAPSGATVASGVSGSEAFVRLETPAGDFNPYDTNNGARLMQSAADEDFQLAARWLTSPTEQYQGQGFLVEQDAGNWIRFDIYSNGSALYAYGGVTTNGDTRTKFNVSLGTTPMPYMRLTREDDRWTFELSEDGTNWTVSRSFTAAITVSAVGLMSNSSGGAPGYVAEADYFESTADPIVAEDGNISGNTAPVAVDDSAETDADTAVVLNVLANDSDADGDTLTVTATSTPSNGTVVINGDNTVTYTPNAGYTGSDSFTYTISDGTDTTTATANVNVGSPISVWYGNTQSFGSLGETQTWVNVLGNVDTTNIASLSYTLNGGSERTLELGPDTRRLQENGDFNVDIAFDDLDGTATDDVVTIIARYNDGSVYTQEVTLEYESGNTWDANYSIDWSSVTNIQDVVQVVDGKWAVTNDGLRLEETGYDRFVLLGDNSWDYYEVDLSFTGHDLYSEDPRGRDGGVFGFGVWWEGHTDDPLPNWQPKAGYNPSEWLLYYNDDPTGRFRFFTDGGHYPTKFEEGTEYNVSIRVEQANVLDRLYSVKVWEVGTTEPTDWLFQRVIEADEPITSSFALLSHYYDVTFHDINVTEITGSDIVKGTDGADLLSAVDAGSGTPGRGELDIFEGYAGADVFIFGDATSAYYDDGTTSAGLDDYGYAFDFQASEDQVQLHGSAAEYSLSENVSGLPNGTAIWKLGASGEEDELVGVLANTYGLSLNENVFVFVDMIA